MTAWEIDKVLLDMTIEREAKKVKEMHRFVILKETKEYEERFKESRRQKQVIRDVFGNLRKVETRFSLRVSDFKNIRTKTIIKTI